MIIIIIIITIIVINPTLLNVKCEFMNRCADAVISGCRWGLAHPVA